MRWLKILVLSLIAVVLLAGCAAPAGDAAVNWKDGAKHGWVVDAYAADAPASTLPVCLAALAPADYASRHFVNVRYFHVRAMHYEVAEVPPGLTVHDGDRVEVWPLRCSAGQISRVTRVFAPETN